jgi:hypothetical protein|nr:T9SS type A sorting domain-containing protein [Bacteroidales bacterium]
LEDDNDVCDGTAVTFTATPTNGGLSPSYDWLVNGTSVGAPDQNTFTSNMLNDGDDVEVIMTSSETCTSGNPATSNSVTMAINPILTADVSVSADMTTICSGSTVTFTATPTNGGATPSYMWFVNGVNVGAADSPTFTSSSLNDGENVYCSMTSSETCVTNSPATSNTLTVTVNSVPVVPTVDVQCVGTGGAGVITVTDPIGVEYTYSLDGITYQSEPVFSDVANGTYILTVDNAGCTNQSAEFTVDCACDNPASLVLSSTTAVACSHEDYVLSGNTFGGSATEVGVTHNGNGSLEQSVFTTSPFEIVYIQDPTDLNTDITFTVTTDDPAGDLCEAVSEQLIITVNESPVIELLTDTVICVGEQFTYTLTETYDAVYWSDGTNGNTYSMLYDEVLIDTVTVTVENNGCFVTDTMILDIQICDFIDMTNDMRINLYPNPTKDVVHMEIIDYHGKFAVSLVNMQGQVIQNAEYATDGEFNTSFDMQNLTPGLYLYRIEMNDKLHHFKIVKQ